MRIIVCISFVIIWVIWLTSLTKVKNQKLENRKHKIETKEQKAESREQNPHLGFRTSRPSNISTQAHKHTLNELPKLANLILIKEGDSPAKREPTSSERLEIRNQNSQLGVLNFSSVAQATKKVLLSNNLSSINQSLVEESPLRKKVPIKKTNRIPMPQNTTTLETNSEKEWLPKYITATRQMAPKVENTTNNLDKIANQVELVGIISNPNGNGAAIIRNKTNNKIEILKTGEEYQELKLLEIKNNEVILGNLNLNKTYTKKIVI